MGGKTAAQISTQLVLNGMSPATPIVICKSVARPGFSRWSGILGDLAAGMATIGVSDPVLIGVGPVFAAKAEYGATRGIGTPQTLAISQVPASHLRATR